MTRQIAERQGQHLKALRIHIDHADQPRILIQPGSACHNVLGTHTIPECIKVECDIQASHLNQEHQDTPASRQRPCPAHPARYFPRSPAASRFVTVHAYVPSNGICRGFAFKYGKFLLPPRFLTALSVPKVPTRVQ